MSLADRLLSLHLPASGSLLLRRAIVVLVLALGGWIGLTSPTSAVRWLPIPVGLIGLGFALRWPRWQMPGLLLIAAFVPLEIGTGTGSAVNGVMLGVAGIFGLWLLQSALSGQIRLPASPANRPWLLLIGLALISIVAGAAFWSPWVVTKGNFYLVQAAQLSLFGLSAAAYWLPACRLESRLRLQQFSALLLGLGLLFLLSQTLPGLGWIGRFLLLGGPIFRICVVALAGALALYHQGLGQYRRIGLAALALLMVALPWWRGSDWASGWLPSLVTLSVLLAKYIWSRMGWRIAPHVTLLGIFGAVALLPRLAIADYWSLDTRLIAWSGLAQLMEGRWILGLGLASYWHYWRGVIGSIAYQDPTTGYLHFSFDPKVNLHNNFADILAQVGILGLVVLLWLFFELTRHALRRFSAEPAGSFGRAYAAAALAAVAGMAFAGMLGDWFLPFVYNIGLRGFRDSFLGWLLLGGVALLDATADEAVLPLDAPAPPAASEAVATPAGDPDPATAEARSQA
jgi:hypothetical protein